MQIKKRVKPIQGFLMIVIMVTILTACSEPKEENGDRIPSIHEYFDDEMVEKVKNGYALYAAI